MSVWVPMVHWLSSWWLDDITMSRAATYHGHGVCNVCDVPRVSGLSGHRQPSGGSNSTLNTSSEPLETNYFCK